MQKEIVSVKCAMCGTESEHERIISKYTNDTRVYLDMRSASYIDSYLESVQECPRCHYCYYDISKKIVEFNWLDGNDEIMEIINNKKLSDAARKAMLMHFVSDYTGETEMVYKWAIVSAWCIDECKLTEIADQYRVEAGALYQENIMNKQLSQMIQVSDLLRQLKDFDSAIQFAEKLRELISIGLENEDEHSSSHYMIKVLDSIIHFSKKGDNKPHLVSDIENDKL